MTTSECEFGSDMGKSAVDYLYDFIIEATRLSPEEQEVWKELCKKRKMNLRKNYSFKPQKNANIRKTNLIKKLLGRSFKMKLKLEVPQRININPILLNEDIEPLSKREEEVLELILNGYGFEDLMEKLHITQTTVKTHIYNIYSKKQVHNLHQLCVKCFWEQQEKPTKPNSIKTKELDYKNLNKLLRTKI